MSLRERKQARQRQDIIENAVALFRSSGFARVRVREIAARCEISDATFFNYFASKESLLSEWVHREVDEMIRSVCEGPEDSNLRRPLRLLVKALEERADSDAELMRTAWQRARLVAPGAEQRGRVTDAGHLAGLVARAQSRGELRADVPAEQLAALLRATIVDTLAQSARATDPGALEPLGTWLSRAVELVLDGARKRNERVRPGAGRAVSTRPAPPSP